MERFDFNQKLNIPIAIALGFFDCIHLGHQKLVECAKNLASTNDNGAQKSALLTFSNDPNVFFEKSQQIYSFDDRVNVLENLGLDIVISANFDDEFANLSPIEFLDKLTSNFNVKAIIVGNDYTFGKNAQGNVNFIAEYCKNNGISLKIVPFEMVNGEKLSTRTLKEYVTNGSVSTLNGVLCENYFIHGRVISERHQGKSIGFPTANLRLPNDRLKIKDGIYATRTLVDGVWHNSMTNVGSKPTFDDSSVSVETYIFDFDSNIYGKYVKVAFVERIRDVQKFESIDELTLQLKRDEAKIRRLLEK